MFYNMMLANFDSLFFSSVSNINSSTSWLMFTQAVAQLVFLIVLFIILYYIMRKLRGSYGLNDYKRSTIKIIERKYLNNFASLTLTKVNNKILLLGITKEKITLLAEFEEENFDFNELDTNKFKDIFENKFLNLSNYKNRSAHDKEEN